MTEVLVSQLIDVDKLIPSEENPQIMSPEEFNRLVKSIQTEGFDENLLVVPMDGGFYKIVSGEHRWRAAKVLNIRKVPCVVKTYDDDKRKFELVKRNVLKGKLDAKKFIDLYNQLSGKYPKEIIKEMMALEAKELDKLIGTVKESLPPELQKKLEEARDEIKTIDDLSLVLNKMFSEYGSTLDYNFMILDFGGKKHLWVRLNEGNWSKLTKIADYCKNSKKDINEVLNQMIDQSEVLVNG